VILYVHVVWYADGHSFKLTDVLALVHSGEGNVGAVQVVYELWTLPFCQGFVPE
jgi:hypothetical protein